MIDGISGVSNSPLLKGNDILGTIPVMFIKSCTIPVGDWAAAAGIDANPAKLESKDDSVAYNAFLHDLNHVHKWAYYSI